MERRVNAARANEGPHVLELSYAEAKRVSLRFKRERDDENCHFSVQPIDAKRAFVKIFCRDPGEREAFVNEITRFLTARESSPAPETPPTPTNRLDIPTYIRQNIDGPEMDLRDIVLLRPFAAEYLNKSKIQRGTALQRAAWADLFERKSMLLLAPRNEGKTAAYLPVALTASLKMNAFILTSTESRLAKLDNELRHELPIKIARPPSRILNSGKQLVICNIHWFWHNRQSFTPSMIVFDGLDQMIGSALNVTCVELANAYGEIPVVATAREYSAQLEETVKLMNIKSAVMVSSEPRVRNIQEFLISLDDAVDSARYSGLVETLRKQNFDEVVLIFFNNEKEVHTMYEKLEEEANRGTDLRSCSFNNLREDLEDERDLLRRFLREGRSGVYLACLQDHQWLYRTTCVDVIINYHPPDCAQAYRYRRERLRDGGKNLTLIRGLDLNPLPSDLLHLIAQLPGYEAVSPSIQRLRDNIRKESRLRDALRFHLLQ